MGGAGPYSVNAMPSARPPSRLLPQFDIFATRSITARARGLFTSEEVRFNISIGARYFGALSQSWLHAAVTAAVLGAADTVSAGPAFVTCRFTHVYPDGPAPYFTVLACGREPDQLAQWDAIKAAASDALIAHGGTITCQSEVGRGTRFTIELPALRRLETGEERR